ncbi:HelD family protein [Streptomyces sp. 796.1]|uniref:HelD family protein n=1 Tax=Streptomyces sp. 796.1 TaxID=3163029 RepID=UPI0039C959C5
MVAAARRQVKLGEDVSGDGASAEVLGRYLRSYARQLAEEPEGPLFFGRLDFDSTPGAGDHRGQRYYVGRRHVAADATATPLVIDWRAPVSRVFYQASPRDPQGVAVRRRFGWAPASKGEPADLTGLEDERLGAGRDPLPAAGPASGPVPGPAPAPGAGVALDATSGGAGLPATGSRIVAAEIERPRVGPMRDIVATIQPEQDELVRRPLTDSVCVQGAPGTGKTAVGLHRAAYLLYTYPQRIQRGGLLVVGPNRTFLRYIAEVLPALGEIDVRQCTVGDLVDRFPVRAEDGVAAASVKHDARMAQVLARALHQRVRPPDESLAIPDGTYRWRVGADELHEVVTQVQEQAPPYATGREWVRSRTMELVRRQVERRAGPPPQEWVRRMSRSRAVKEFLDAAWPAVRPEEVVADLLGDPQVVRAAADGLLTDAEQAALCWAKPPRSVKSAKWSTADLVLIDEVAGLIERPEGYGHVVVDEAQDLSPMECRVLARRSDFGSLTVLGDLAQGTTPWAARSWPEHLAHLGKPNATVAPLTSGFRVPAAIVAAANELLTHLAADVPPARSLRADGELRVCPVPEIAAGVVAAVRRALPTAGSIGVISADAALPSVRRALSAAGIATTTPDGVASGGGGGARAELGADTGGAGVDSVSGAGSGGGAEAGAGTGGAGAASRSGSAADAEGRVTLLPASIAKGLEYDHVIAVEPADIVAAEPRGLHRLYVVLTRAVSRLHIVHARPLPAELSMLAPTEGGTTQA